MMLADDTRSTSLYKCILKTAQDSIASMKYVAALRCCVFLAYCFHYRDAEDVQRAVAAVAEVAHMACSDAARDWNEQQTTSTHSLPPEVLEECFSWLDIYGCVKAACVCGTWRSIALAAPYLWTSITVVRPRDLDPSWSVLETILKRSGTLPLHLDLRMQGKTGDLTRSDWPSAIMAKCLSRTRVLTGTHSLAFHLVSDSAPLLETAHHPGATLRLRDAPRLREVSVYKFDDKTMFRPTFASDRPITEIPFPSLTKLTIRHIDKTWSARCLFDACPNLVELDIAGSGVNPMYCMPVHPIPASLVDVTLRFNCLSTTWQPETGSMRPYLKLWHGHAMRRFRFFTEVDARAIFHVFFSIYNGPYAMSCANSFCRLTSTAEDSLEIEHTPPNPNSPALWLSQTPVYFENLEALTLTGENALLMLVSATLLLPSLRSLTIVRKFDSIPEPSSVQCTLRVPQLQTVFWCISESGHNWPAEIRDALHMCSNVLKPQAGHFERFVFRNAAAVDTEGVSFSALRRYASRVFLGKEEWTRVRGAAVV